MSDSSGAVPGANRLARETSAYLRQHQDNPVEWYPWGEEAFAQARDADKPILVSIGYSACHWCHVMAHESFENDATAALMNRLFVNVKVDREERPDVDQIYLDTVVRFTGQGGWPLTIFCMPDGRPFYGGTYFPPRQMHGRASFSEVLVAAEHAYRERRDEVENTADQVLRSLDVTPESSEAADPPVDPPADPPGLPAVARAAQLVMENADHQHGGFGGGPKFPTPTNLELLLCVLDFVPPDDAARILEHCVLTCREMSRRGLYDHLAGGFHRYCVDDHWGIPHFEKMLYDQGLLMRVYAEVWRRTRGAEDLAWPIRETAAYLRREMRGPEGAFYASQDADAEGVEGKYNVWTPEQVREVLGGEAEGFCAAYGVTHEGNFEDGTTHLWDRARLDRSKLASERAGMLAAREQRVAPGTDTKRVASWNGYVIAGLARAGSLLGDEAMLADAVTAARFVRDEMRDEQGRLLRSYDGGRAHIPAFLDDHASLLDAALELFRAGAGEDTPGSLTGAGEDTPGFLAWAMELAGAIADRFFDEEAGDLFLTAADSERLVHRPRSDHDGATPAAAGLATLGLVRAAALSGNRRFAQIAEQVFDTHAAQIAEFPHSLPTMLRALALARRGPAVALIVGAADDPTTAALSRRARQVLLPDDAVVVADPRSEPPPGLDPGWLEGRMTPAGSAAVAYVCRGETCSLPVSDPAKLFPLEGLRA